MILTSIFSKQFNAAFNLFSKIEEKNKQVKQIKKEVDEDMTDEETKFDKDVIMKDYNEEEISAHQKNSYLK